MPEVFTSTANRTVRAVRDLHQRKNRRARLETIIEGPTVFGEFIDAGIIPLVVLCTQSDALTIERCASIGVEPVRVTEEVLASASDTRAPRSPVAVVGVPEQDEARLHNTLVLIDIQDPGNVGTMIRTAAALGWDVAVAGATAEAWSPKTIRSSAGTHVRTRVIPMDNPVTDAATVGLTTVATIVAGGAPPQPQNAPIALFIGSEAHGLSPETVQECDSRATLAMPGGTESLNAAVAASIMMYAMSGIDGSSIADTMPTMKRLRWDDGSFMG
jgi:TrmH family RNA methyltransferase